MSLAKVKRIYISRNGGSLSRGVPRISNLTQGREIVGYTQVNTLAVSVLGRVKIHKGYFYCNVGEVADGDLVLDRHDGKHYLVMSSKEELQGYEVIYYDSTLINCEQQISIARFDTQVAKDFFGKPAIAEPQVVATGVWCMINPKNYTQMDQQDRMVPQNKITVYVQSNVGVKQADRLTSTRGRNYLVESVDQESLTGIDILYVDLDER